MAGYVGPKRPGRPRGHKPLIDVIGAKRRVELIEKAYENAMAGDAAAMKMLLDRMDPTLTRAQLAGDAENPIALEHAQVEAEAATLSTDMLRDLEQMAERLKLERGHGANGRGNGAAH